MRNRVIGLCGIALFSASCVTSQTLPLAQEGPPQSSRGGSALSAVQALRASAEQGNAEAQFNLGLLYDHGRGLPKNKGEALQWYRRAAMQGDTFAQNSLGVLGTPKGRRHGFVGLFHRGEAGDDPDWASFRASTLTNPYIPAEEVETARKELPPEIFQQEFEGVQPTMAPTPSG